VYVALGPGRRLYRRVGAFALKGGGMAADDDYPSEEDLLEALESPGPLSDHSAVQALRAARERELRKDRPTLTLIRGGRDA
jgi:hypothetical protein